MTTDAERTAIDAAELFYETVKVRLYPPHESFSPSIDHGTRTGTIAIIAALILIDHWQTDRDDTLLDVMREIRDGYRR